MLVSFISPLSAMTVRAQIPEKEIVPTLPALSVPPIETFFVRMHIIGYFLCHFTKIGFHTSSNHVGGIWTNASNVFDADQ